MKTLSLTLAAALCGALPALAQEATCALQGGTSVAEAEALNALVLGVKFDELTTVLSQTIAGLPPDALDGLKGAYAQPFTSCTTLVQRQETGALTQHVVLFEGAQPLFVYWAMAPFNGRNGVVVFNMDSTFGPVMDMLR